MRIYIVHAWEGQINQKHTYINIGFALCYYVYGYYIFMSLNVIYLWGDTEFLLMKILDETSLSLVENTKRMTIPNI